MSDDQGAVQPGITRREALKRGAILGGALVWATPVVQTIGMRPAFAEHDSPLCCTSVRLFDVGFTTIVVGGEEKDAIEWSTEVCNCGTHADDVNPAVEFHEVGVPLGLIDAYTCAKKDPESDDNVCAVQLGLTEEWTHGTGDWVFQAFVTARQDGVVCSDESDQISVTGP